MGGLACAARLAAAGYAVTVVERAAAAGGKLRTHTVGGLAIDSGPTVLTMAWVFEELFAACGASLADHVGLERLHMLARHAWAGGAQLDLFADRAASADAIGAFAGVGAADGYRRFCAQARRIYEAMEHTFIRADRPTALSLTARVGVGAMMRIAPFTSLWRALKPFFADPRLRQLFGRYATYCGASPMLAPSTLMLVAHVEGEGVWTVPGGMQRLAAAVVTLAERHGAIFRYGESVAEIVVASGRAAGVRLASGEQIAADAVVVNADAAALVGGAFGAAPSLAARTDATRSLSATTWSIAGRPRGLGLRHHNVFFSDDYEAEFDDIGKTRMPAAPTVYLCAQDRGDTPLDTAAPERLFCIVNAPADGDRHAYQPGEISACRTAMTRLFEACGLTLGSEQEVVTTPSDFAALFPSTGGALYGPATHGPFASFRRPGARTKMPGLYLAGGSVHPGPGLPMAALSGARAAASVLADGVSTSRSRPTAIVGGISTR